MRAKEFRKFYASLREDTDKLRDLNFVGCYHKVNNEISKKGFFDLYHGDKENEIGFLRTQVEIAEDGQAIYEFLQNAVDAHATEFYIFWDRENFLVINNGDKFNKDGIRSILNFSQSTKPKGKCSIGNFGIGFKLIHRLVGNKVEDTDEENGLKEIVYKYNGPVLFSWDDDYLKNLINNDLSKIDQHWLFKIIYTNFPSGLGEEIRDREYKKRIVFKHLELDSMINFVKKQNISMDNLSKGSMFYLKLGQGKSILLNDELNNIKDGIENSLGIIQAFQKSCKVKDHITKIVINNLELKANDFYPIQLKDSFLLFPKDIERTLKYYRLNNSEKISFFKFFPMGDQRNGFNFIVHSDKFDIESNRRKLHDTEQNKEILTTIGKSIFKSFNKESKQYQNILANMYLSDLETANHDKVIQENFSQYLLEYIKKNIPYISSNDSHGSSDLKTTGDESKVVVVTSDLHSIPLKKYKHFYFDLKVHTDIVVAAVEKLSLTEWDIVDVLLAEDLGKWILSLNSKNFNIFLQEIEKYRRNDQQIVEKFKYDQYSLSQIKKVLQIFAKLDKNNIIFAVVKINDKYEINTTIKNMYIKNKRFKEFLENTNEVDHVYWYLIPEELETDVTNIINKNAKDKEVLKELLKGEKHKKVVDFIEEYQLETFFIDTLYKLNFDTDIDYRDGCFEYKVLDIALKINDEQVKNTLRNKIFFGNTPMDKSLISKYITFTYGKVTNPKTYDNQLENNIETFISKFDDKYFEFFRLKEDSKENIYQYIKNEIIQYLRLKKQINTKNRLKFILYYSLMQKKNYFKEFNGVNIFNHHTREDDSFGILYKILKDIGEKNLKDAPFIISDLLPTLLGEPYYIKEEKFAIKKEYLPDNFEDKYIKVFKNIGFKVNEELLKIRKNLISNNQVEWGELRKLDVSELINTIEYLAVQKKEYKRSSKESKVLKNIFKALDQQEKVQLQYLPCLKNLSTVVIKKINLYEIYCITKESFESKNKIFRDRLSREIKSNNIIDIDILDIDKIPQDWEEIEESENELNEAESLKINKEKSELQAVIQDATEYSEYTAEIGTLGELFAKELLNKKFGTSNVQYNNEDEENKIIDFYITDSNGEKFGVEVKATISSPNSTEGIKFILSTPQFKKFKDYDKKTYLIFVVGVKSDPEILVMNFDNNWLEPSNGDAKNISKQYDLSNKKVQINKLEKKGKQHFDSYVKESGDPLW